VIPHGRPTPLTGQGQGPDHVPARAPACARLSTLPSCATARALRANSPTPHASEARAGWRGRVCKTPSFPSPACGGGLRWGLAAAGDLGPGVAQADGAVEHQPLGRGVFVRAEIAQPLELHRVIGIAAG
jgi:hypothetical protein